MKILGNYAQDSILKAKIQQDLNNLAFIKSQMIISGEEIIIITMEQVERACSDRILNRLLLNLVKFNKIPIGLYQW